MLGEQLEVQRQPNRLEVSGGDELLTCPGKLILYSEECLLFPTLRGIFLSGLRTVKDHLKVERKLRLSKH